MPDKSEPRDPEPTGRKEWAGLPIAYWIDLCVLEEESLFEILDQLRQQFPGYSREQHIETTITRLTERARKGEISFYQVQGEITTDLAVSDALAQLSLPSTWTENWEQHVVAWQKPRTLGWRLAKLWSRFSRKSRD